MKRFLVVLALLAPAPLFAQAALPPDQAVGSLRPTWQQMTAYIQTAAEELTVEQYAFRPTPQVRSFGELVGHVAGAQYMICAAALGEAQRAEDAVESTVTTKEGLVAALRESTAYCARAYAQSDAEAQAMTSLFGGERTRLSALVLNTVHNAEHYGNVVTYMRMQGLVPPSSRQ